MRDESRKSKNHGGGLDDPPSRAAEPINQWL
jgi:hypothetical protein